jgi:drug/metabolite transporter (DMT)-like permease
MSVPAAFIGVIIIWSTTPLAIRWSSETVGFLFGLTARMALGALACLILVGLLRTPLPWDRDARRTYLAAGLGLFGAMLAVYWSSQYIPSGWISAIFGVAPFVTGLMAARWLSEKALTPTRLAGSALGLSGLTLIFAGGHALGARAAYGVAGVLVSVAVHCASSVAVKRIGSLLSPLAITTGALCVATPLYALVLSASGQGLPASLPARSGAAIVYLGLVGSVAGFVLYYYVLGRVEASRTALITLVTPVLALLLGHWLNAEPIEPRVWAGAAIILAGLWVYHFGPRWRRPWPHRRTCLEVAD